MKFLAVLGALLITSIGARATLTVASLSTITSDIALHVGGKLVTVIPIIKPGIDPHEFEPTPADVKAVANADVVLITGKGIEGYLTKLEEAAGGAGKFVNTGAAFPSLKLEEDGKMVEDPHWWHSIGNVRKAVAVVAKSFAKADPKNASIYEENAATYEAELDDLNQWAKEKISELPRDQRKLVTSHDAFQYFARDYGFKIYAIEGVSSEDEPSSQKVKELIDTIKSQGVKAVFFENIENPKVMVEITRESGAKVGGELFADGLGDKKATTYPDMVRYNVTTIVDELK